MYPDSQNGTPLGETGGLHDHTHEYHTDTLQLGQAIHHQEHASMYSLYY